MDNWSGGCNSLVPPERIDPSQYAWAINCLNRGGIVQTRPGYKLEASIASMRGYHNLQGACIFVPRNSTRPMMLVAVDGEVWKAFEPFQNFERLEGIEFTDHAEEVFFCVVTKNVELNADGSLRQIPPTPMVIMQDGESLPHTYDGYTVRSSTPGSPTFGIPIGSWMAWAGNRLWVAKGTKLFASDLANPDAFSEGQYLAERDAFELPGVITGLIEASDRNGLLVFTDTTTTVFRSNIRDRVQWQTTSNFQELVLPSVGCVAGKSIINHHGLTWWLSASGITNFDAARFTQETTKMIVGDSEMMRSKARLSPDMTGACAGAVENLLFFSMPVGSVFNEETWVMDHAPMGGRSDSTVWAGVWTGMRPHTWLRVTYRGAEQLLCVSKDVTATMGTPVHVWRVLQKEREDNGARILCQLETRMPASEDLMRFRYLELDLMEIKGEVELRAFVGGMRGAWLPILNTTLRADQGSIGGVLQEEIDLQDILQAYAPQNRFLRSEEFSPQGRACSADSADVPGVDKGFQILLEWRGRMGVRSLKVFATPFESKDTGACAGAETTPRIVTETGETIEA